jgi:N-acetylglucosaminyldiphosphoundecaprenol N-acetyl-beta-D-mannosaminyltransferase
MKIDILNVLVDDISKADLLDNIDRSIIHDKKCLIYTVNNEFILEAQTNQEFLQTLNNSTYSIADSTGIAWAANKLHNKKIERIPGADLFIDLVKISQKKSYGIYLLGAGKGVGEKARQEIEKSFPGVKIVGVKDGIKIDPKENNQEIIDEINSAGAKIVCVALGAPKQEMWISNNANKLSANIFIGIGGTLDYTSGNIKRAPRIFRQTGLEWLFRLMRQPSRYNRIKKALIDFPRLVNKELKTKG